MNLRRIEAFLAVAEARNISRAAAQLEVAQSVVSRHVAALEAQLGARLFERTGRGVALTAAGQHLAPRLRAALDEMHRATAEAAAVGDQPSGVVRVGLVPAATRPLAGMLFKRIAVRLPRIRLQFAEGFSNDLEEQLADGGLDLAIINRYTRARRRGEERLCVVDSLVVGPAGSFRNERREIAFAQLAEFPLVLASRPNGLRVALDQLCRRTGVQLQVAVEADSLPTMKDLVIEAGLFSVLPHQLVHEELEAKKMSSVCLVDPPLPRALSLATSTRRASSAASRAVAREIRDIVQSTLVRTVWR